MDEPCLRSCRAVTIPSLTYWKAWIEIRRNAFPAWNNVRWTQNKVNTLKMSRSVQSCTKIRLVTLNLKLSLQKGCYKVHNMSSLYLYYTRRGKEAVSHPFSIPLFLLHGTTLPDSGHVFVSSGVNENIWNVFFRNMGNHFHICPFTPPKNWKCKWVLSSKWIKSFETWNVTKWVFK